jgi:hypothetical protein
MAPAIVVTTTTQFDSLPNDKIHFFQQPRNSPAGPSRENISMPDAAYNL